MSSANHVAIIMDGNGRWALQRGKSRDYGHQQGLKTIEKIVDYSINKKISYLTLFVFSSENWKRPKKEVNFLFKLLESYFKKNLFKVIRNGINLKIIGDKSKLANNLRKIIKLVENKTKKNKKISIQLALNYGSKYEIINSMKIIKKRKKNITIENFEKYLYTTDFPNPDILIRTGGQKRVSNFLLWQIAYTEIFFVNKLWPDFSKNDFQKILNKFTKIKRNFGNI
ncbi:MAG TPA: polyprenyl diphosphate synthase [Pelagibacteraceae bacterium]|jgi:undecaprenyl diphosphate synthase|nr:polyprenyl diphosphate synthase [Pelagibacteraceae bacterium]